MGDSNNYGGIALSPLIFKIVDLIVLSRYYDLLVTSELQFGFESEHFTGKRPMI
jgi:hypothetical protein